jgi:hypothetical protein
MADLVSEDDTPNEARGASHQTSIPQWVKVFASIMVALVLLFVALHLTGHGFGDHATFPSGEQQR